MKKIESEELKQIQYEILLYFKSVCEKYNINYVIGYGTLLGAVRHKGFIPWDDDIDVIMLRKDFESFVDVMKYERHEYYRFCNLDNGQRCHSPYGIIEDTRTAVFHDRFNKNLMKDEGVSIDIFPFDDMPSDEREMKKIINYQKIWKICNNLRITEKYPKSDNNLKKSFKKIGKIISRLIGTRRIFTNMKKIAYRKYNQECIMVGDMMCNPKLSNCFRKQLFIETEDILFEKDYFKAPSNYDEFLSHCYGDYMKLPPVEQRQPIHEYEYFWR